MSDQTAAREKTLLTPANVIAGFIVVLGLGLTFVRFTGGLAAVTNLDDSNPWGIWIAFDLLVGVALAGVGFVTSSAVYIFGIKRMHSAVRPTVVTAFLGYALVVVALHYDVGRPWRLPYPFFVQQGVTSVLFEVGACVALYLSVLFLEFTPAALEWLGWRRARTWAVRMTMALIIFGVILSTLHQSSLGALFLIAKAKVHPLWYSSYLPIYFFVTAIIGGLSMAIFEGTLAHRYFKEQFDEAHKAERDNMVLGFGKACSLVLAGYFLIQVFGLAADNDWAYLATGYGAWYLVELLGFVALPCLLYGMGVRDKNLGLIRGTAVLTVLGVLLNRFNVCLITFNYHLPAQQRYFPSWMEIAISVFLVTVGILAYRFIVTRMPIFFEHPDYRDAH